MEKLEHELTILMNDSSKDELEFLKFGKKLYKSCTDEAAVVARGFQPLKMMISELGGWPAVVGESWPDWQNSWPDVIVKTLQLGLDINFPLFFSTFPNVPVNSTQRMLGVHISFKYVFILLITFFLQDLVSRTSA